MDQDFIKILVVDDEEDLCEILQFNLESQGYHVSVAYSAEEALKYKIEDFHLILLDVMMEGMSGYRFAEKVRKELELSIPIIFLTARGSENDLLTGFNLGGDDYITKPFSPRELVSRVKAVLRRIESTSVSSDELIEVDDRLKIDFNRREIWVEGKLVKLRPTEYRLLYHLVQNAGWVLTYDQILSRVWGYEYRDEPHYVRLYINYLRQKLEKDPSNPKYVLTERGVGYRFYDYRRK